MRMPRSKLASTRHSPSPRQRTNLTIRAEYIAEARELGINLSEACERGLVTAIAEMRADRWLTENREALDASNSWVEANGLPLASKRLF